MQKKGFVASATLSLWSLQLAKAWGWGNHSVILSGKWRTIGPCIPHWGDPPLNMRRLWQELLVATLPPTHLAMQGKHTYSCQEYVDAVSWCLMFHAVSIVLPCSGWFLVPWVDVTYIYCTVCYRYLLCNYIFVNHSAWSLYFNVTKNNGIPKTSKVILSPCVWGTFCLVICCVSSILPMLPMGICDARGYSRDCPMQSLALVIVAIGSSIMQQLGVIFESLDTAASQQAFL